MSRRMPGRSATHPLALLFLILFLILPVSPLSSQSERDHSSAPGLTAQTTRDISRLTGGTPPPILNPITPRAPQTAAIGFPQLARAAGIIFSGTVTAVARHPATTRQPVETVAITFHVENAVRGVVPGEDLSISQWIGLWSSGQRYRVGERLLLFLYPPSKLGLTSCVGASIGRFAIDPAGRIRLSAQQLSAFRSDPVLGGKSRATFSDFALAVQQAGEEAMTMRGSHEN